MKHSSVLFSIFSVILFGFAGTAFAGLGISPSDWIEQNGLQGQKIEKTFYLSRNEAKEDLNFATQITGDMTSWIKIENGNNFTMLKGQQQFPVNVTLTIPKNAEKKEYKGEIRLNSSTSATQSGQIGVLLSALIRIDLTISDKSFLDYDVLQIEIPTQETGNNVNAILKIWNKGNITAKPTKVTVDIFDKFNSTKISSQILTDFSAVTGVGSFSEGQMNFQIPIQLPPEQYWANISVYQDEKVIKSDDITFSIVKAGALKQTNIYFKNNNLLIILGISLAVLIIIIGAVVGLLISRKGSKKKKRKK